MAISKIEFVFAFSSKKTERSPINPSNRCVTLVGRLRFQLSLVFLSQDVVDRRQCEPVFQLSRLRNHITTHTQLLNNISNTHPLS
jgi:hypothetical protein